MKTIAVLGLGTMGHGIAQNFALAGYSVRCFDELESARATLAERISANLVQLAMAELADPSTFDAVLARIEICADERDAVGPADFVTEAVTEDLAVKQELFSRLEASIGPHTILASNSSTFPMTQTAANMRHPERAIVTHYFNPANIVPVVEVVPGEKTSEETTQATLELLRGIGKKAIRINKEIPGFLVNRVQTAMYREVWDLLSRGIADAADIDEAIRGSMGLRLAAVGPLRINDFAGLEINALTYELMIPHMRGDHELPAKIQQLIDQGNYGVKTGSGIYEYTPDSIQEETSRRDQRYLALLKLFNYTSAGDAEKK